MDSVKIAKFKFLLSVGVGICIGALWGTTSVTAFMSHRMDEYYEQIKRLESDIMERDTRLQKLEESINKQKYMIKDIQIELLYEEDDLDKIALEKHIKEKYMSLLGKEVKSMDMDLIQALVDKRIMKVHRIQYQLKVQKIIVTDILKLWIEVSIYE